MDNVDVQITTPTPIMMSKIKPENAKPSFRQMLGSGRVKVGGGVPYYFFIKLLTNHCPPRSLNCVLDTGSMATVCQSKYLTNQDYFFNEKAEKRDVQVVGAKTTKQDTYKLLIGVNDSHHSHILSNCLAVEKIVDPIST